MKYNPPTVLEGVISPYKIDEYYDAKAKRIAKAKAELKNVEALLMLIKKKRIDFQKFKAAVDTLREAILDID